MKSRRRVVEERRPGDGFGFSIELKFRLSADQNPGGLLEVSLFDGLSGSELVDSKIDPHVRGAFSLTGNRGVSRTEALAMIG